MRKIAPSLWSNKLWCLITLPNSWQLHTLAPPIPPHPDNQLKNSAHQGVLTSKKNHASLATLEEFKMLIDVVDSWTSSSILASASMNSMQKLVLAWLSLCSAAHLPSSWTPLQWWQNLLQCFPLANPPQYYLTASPRVPSYLIAATFYCSILLQPPVVWLLVCPLSFCTCHMIKGVVNVVPEGVALHRGWLERIPTWLSSWTACGTSSASQRIYNTNC